ncbi:hypothetical protein V7654_12900 [Bacillus sp. JJ1609]|uniref:hypothetical protein n=1 Tax=Bacillus sp. JJ1609 TaxID=3122977 RepID=UPI0030008175
MESKKNEIVSQLDCLLAKHKVQPVGSGYIDCIVLKGNLDEFINEITALGILITNVSWWCYVDPSDKEAKECPHGLGGPVSEHYEGWFSELQNDDFSVDDDKISSILNSYNENLIYTINMQTLDEIKTILKTPFRYTPTDYIEGNKCVMPGLWLLVPDDWERC